jgi:hypothetical protein
MIEGIHRQRELAKLASQEEQLREIERQQGRPKGEDYGGIPEWDPR